VGDFSSKLGDISLRELASLVGRWYPAALMLGLALVGVISGSAFGFNLSNVFGGLVLAIGGAVIALVAHDTVRKNEDQLRPTILVGCLLAAIFGFMLSIQSQCISGTGRECDQSEALPRESARHNTELALIVLVGISGATIGGAVVGFRDARSR
jgi:hypothetical protein